MSTSFSEDDFDEEGNLKELPQPGGEDDGDPGEAEPSPPPPSSTLRDLRVPDDYEDEDLRGVDGQTLLHLLKTSKEVTKRAIEQANAATASSSAAAASAASLAMRDQPGQQQPPDHLLTKDELITGDPDAINNKLERLFAAKAAPLVNSIYQGFSQQAYMLAKNDKANMPYFEEFEDEILEEAKRLTVGQTASMDTWRHLYHGVENRHRDTIIDREVKKRLEAQGGGNGGRSTAQPELQPGRSTSASLAERGSGAGGDKIDPVSRLSDDQKRYARLLGVKPEEAAQYLPEE